MKDTISDISHQLKTPLAALNIYNGIMQEETKDMETLREFTALQSRSLTGSKPWYRTCLKLRSWMREQS